MSYRFNPFTGTLDKVISKSDITEIIYETVPAEEIRKVVREVIGGIKTTEYGALGNKLYAYDPVEDKWVEMGQRIMYDEDGNIMIEAPEE